MGTTITVYGDVAVLAVKNELAGDEVGQFVSQASQCANEGACRVVVDCSSLSGFDSEGLEALLDFQNKCEEELGVVKLCGLDETCAKILEITRLARRFETFEDLESAVKSFS